MKRVCVFCGSNRGDNPAYASVAIQLGEILAARNMGLVYGGGCVGLMGVLADAVLANGGDVIGVIPKHLSSKEIAHYGLKDLRVVDSMHQRKALMAELADGFITLPGGFGTFEEFLEIVTWGQLGLHRKPAGLLNVCGFYNPLLAQMELSIREGFIRRDNARLILASENPEDLIKQMLNFIPI